MKKTVLFMLLIGVVFLSTSCSFRKKIKSYKEITFAELEQKIENKDTFPLFIGSETCTHCADYKVTLNRLISNYHVPVYYIDVNKLNEEQLSKLLIIANFSGTPTTVFIVDGEEKTVYNRISGALSYDKVVSKFKKAGYIKEK